MLIGWVTATTLSMIKHCLYAHDTYFLHLGHVFSIKHKRRLQIVPGNLYACEVYLYHCPQFADIIVL